MAHPTRIVIVNQINPKISMELIVIRPIIYKTSHKLPTILKWIIIIIIISKTKIKPNFKTITLMVMQIARTIINRIRLNSRHRINLTQIMMI